MELPEFLKEKLIKQYGENITEKIIEGYNSKRITTLRVNRIKSNIEEVCSKLDLENIKYDKVEWNTDALIIKNASVQKIQELEMYINGEIYLQSLSSMLPPIILDVKENEDVLDMAAAPGGKTTQIASLTQNKAHITACELNTVRAERLKYNVQKQGASCVNVMQTDARNLNDFFAFDKILLDAPCSGSGTLELNSENYNGNFTEKLIEKSVKSQITLLKKAIKVLKKNHEMVYSTCSILKEENEDVIEGILKQNNIEILPIDLKIKEQLPLLPCKIKEAICVCPTEQYEGFFVVKLKKK